MGLKGMLRWTWHLALPWFEVHSGVCRCFTVSRACPVVSSKESACNAGAAGGVSSIPGWERSPGGGHGNPLRYSWLENPMDRGACMLQSVGPQRVRHD